MVTIYKRDDRIKIQVGEAFFYVSPMSFKQKSEIQAMALSVASGETQTNRVDMIFQTLKHSIKGADGLKNSDGTDYKLEMVKYDEKTDVLADSAVEDLMSCSVSGEMYIIANNLIAGIPSEIINPATGQSLPNVKVVKNSSKKKTRKK